LKILGIGYFYFNLTNLTQPAKIDIEIKIKKGGPMSLPINEHHIFGICRQVIGKNTNGKISVDQTYKIILDLEHYPKRWDKFIQVLNQSLEKFNMKVSSAFISPDKTPACTIIYLEKPC